MSVRQLVLGKQCSGEPMPGAIFGLSPPNGANLNDAIPPCLMSAVSAEVGFTGRRVSRRFSYYLGNASRLLGLIQLHRPKGLRRRRDLSREHHLFGMLPWPRLGYEVAAVDARGVAVALVLDGDVL